MRPAYVLPLRWEEDTELADLTGYLAWLADHADVVVVDGSPPELFECHARHWRGLVEHVPVAADLRFGNGKVNGVLTGLRHVRAERVVIADDDVRYDAPALVAVTALLTGADLVLPQNYFRPLPWHARWDTGRILLNRALGHDFPGTVALRPSVVPGGYDGDVLFENLELLRTVLAAGGTVRRADDVMVRRRPPTAARFWSQRVRQAYDSQAQPARLVVESLVLPAVVGAVWAGRGRLLVAAAVMVVGVAEVGRRRSGGTAVFPGSVVWWAPVWVAERGVCAWLAVAARLSGGVRYSGRRLRVAAHSTAWLRARGPR